MGKRKRGRPVEDNPKNIRIDVRIDLETWDKLDRIINEVGLSKSDIVRRSINLYYNYLNF